MVADLYEAWFIFSLIWTMGATCDKDGRAMFDEYIRRIMKEEGFKMMFPTEGLVYDYKLDDGGASVMEKTEDEEVEVKARTIQWVTWMQDLPAHKVRNVPLIYYRHLTIFIGGSIHEIFRHNSPYTRHDSF